MQKTTLNGVIHFLNIYKYGLTFDQMIFSTKVAKIYFFFLIVDKKWVSSYTTPCPSLDTVSMLRIMNGRVNIKYKKKIDKDHKSQKKPLK